MVSLKQNHDMLWSTESRVPQLLSPYAMAAEAQVPWNLRSAMRDATAVRSTGTATGEEPARRGGLSTARKKQIKLFFKNR